MFIGKDWNETETKAYCLAKYGIDTDFTWPLRTFGGFNYTIDYKYYTNIIWSNGEYDPWIEGGVYTPVNLNQPVLIVKNGSHHLDLRPPAAGDNGTNVEHIRDQEIANLELWIKAYQDTPEEAEEVVEAHSLHFMQ